MTEHVTTDRSQRDSRLNLRASQQQQQLIRRAAAAVDKNGAGWIAYLEFKHNSEHNQLRANVRREITDFSKLKAATGGDQVWVRKVAGGEPIAITAAGGDLYRPAIAADGTVSDVSSRQKSLIELTRSTKRGATAAAGGGAK